MFSTCPAMRATLPGKLFQINHARVALKLANTCFTPNFDSSADNYMPTCAKPHHEFFYTIRSPIPRKTPRNFHECGQSAKVSPTKADSGTTQEHQCEWMKSPSHSCIKVAPVQIQRSRARARTQEQH